MTPRPSQLADRPATAAPDKPASVTVIVPVRNEEAFLAHTLDQLLAQDRDHIELEILVVDGQSTDRTLEIARGYAARHPQIRVLDNPRRLSSAARNLAIQHSQGEYVVIVDGHCEIPTRQYFHSLVDAFRRTGADCLGRPQPLDVTDASPLQRAIALARSSRLGHHPESFIYADEGQFVPAKSVAVAYRRDVFGKVGLFDESLDAHEDGEFNYRCDRAGLTCYLEPAITVRYFPRDSLQGLFRQMVRYGRGRVRFSRKHRGTWRLGSIIPALFLLGLAAGGVLAFFSTTIRPVYLTILVAYLACLLGAAASIAWRNRQLGLLFRLPAVFATIHVGAGVGTWRELLRVSR